VSSPAASDDTTDNEPPIVFVPRPRENRDLSLCIVPEEAAIPPPAGQPGHGSGAVLRRQPVRIVEGHVEGGYTDMYELLCPSYATPICDRTATNCFHTQSRLVAERDRLDRPDGGSAQVPQTSARIIAGSRQFVIHTELLLDVMARARRHRSAGPEQLADADEASNRPRVFKLL